MHFYCILDQLLQENTLLDEGWKDVYIQFVETNKVPEDVFQEFRRSDPSGTGKYLLWMCKQYILNPERARHIIDVVHLFHQQVTRKLLKDKDADIYRHDLESADTAAQKAAQKVSKTQKRKEEKSQSIIVAETDDYLIVVPESHKASCFYGANTKWCISGRTAEYWDRYYRRGVKIYIIVDKKQNKKYALAVYKNGKIEAYNEQDKRIKLSTIEKALGVDFLASVAKPATKQELSKRAKVQIQKILDSCIKNPDGTYSSDGDVDLAKLGLKQLPVQFKEVKGSFYCDSNQLTTLEGAPQKVGGSFSCGDNQLTALKGAPQKVGWDFSCDYNQLTTLKGAPQGVGGGFFCYSNQLTTLEGAPQEVGDNFSCGDNQLTTLKGAPQEVGGDFYCYYNKLITLEGAPRKIGGSFLCNNNQLTTLEGAPQEVGRDFDCNHNQLTTLKGAPQKVGWDFYCKGNPVPPEKLKKTVSRPYLFYQNRGGISSLTKVGRMCTTSL